LILSGDTVGAATGAELIRFLDYVGDKGLMHPVTAKAYKFTSREILGTVEGETWESVDLRTLDVDDVLARFATKAGMRYTPKSLQSYKSRFRKALALYIEYLEDPGGWRPARPQARPSTTSGRGRRATSPASGIMPAPLPSGITSAPSGPGGMVSAPGGPGGPVGMVSAPGGDRPLSGSPVPPPQETGTEALGGHPYARRLDMHNYTYPIRREGRTVFATLQLPVDLTMKEAERIGAYLKTLAVEELPALPRPPHPDAG
jgi:hypothetical protein